jgi:hypothetical protein
MNITELDSYNLGDAVKFNDHLNPRLWDSNEHLKPEVKAQLLLIAEDFCEFLGVTDLDLEDITISGSNAAYTYTPSSDIDLHLVVKMPDDAVYRELFDAKKFQYNEQHNIKIGGYDVELYVQSADQPHISQGIYSVLKDDWVQVPRRRRAEVDDTSTRNKYEKVGLQIERAVRSGNLKRISQLAEKIKKMRQTGLEQHGEFGPENLAFKMLRKQGLIKQLYDARNAAKDRELSLKEKAAVKTPVKYGFRTPEIVEAAPVEPTPVPSDEEILRDFIDFCFKELKLKSMPTVKLRKDPQWSVRNKTFGRYINDHDLLEVAWGQRHIMDVLRTVAHELTHRHQHERESVPSDAGETGSPYENEANARAGILMRDYARLHPDYFAVGQAENLHADEVKESASGYIPTKKQAKDPRFSMALTQDIRPGQLGKEANKLKLKTNKQGIPQVANPNGLFEKLALELSQFKTVTESTEQLDEVRMAPSNLMQWATSPEAQGIRAGFEAELIFRDTTNNGDSDYEMEPDYDSDERCTSLGQVVDFFESGDYGISSRQAERLREQLDEAYYEWYDEQMYKDFRDEAEDLIRKVLVDEDDWDLDNEIQKQLVMQDVSDDELNAIIQAGEKAPKFTSSKEQILYAEANPLYDKYLDAQKEAEGLLDDLVADEFRKEGAIWDAALDDFRDNYSLDDDSGFFDDAGLRWMSDVANSYDLDWPYMTGGGGNDGSRDWEEIGTSLQNTVDMPVKVSSGYHNATRKEGLWIVEPDTSLEADDREDMGLEIVSPPMPLLVALEKLQQVCDWANNPQEGNAYTNGSTGLHMGVSVPFKGGDVDYLKLILFLGDEYVLKSFGREANTYCKSAMSKFKENIKGGRADPMAVIKLMQSGLLELAHREIQKGVGDGKYTSAHIQKGYIEFRSPGGDWLAEESADPEKLQSTMLRFARAMSLAANPAEERREYAKKLYKLVAPEGDSELALFSQFASGELTAEQLKKRWAEKTIGTEKKMNQRWRLYQMVDGRWEPVPGAEWNGYPEDEVKMRVWAKYGREALDSGEYQLVNMGEQDWEVYDVKTGVTLEIVKGKSKGEVADAVFDKYVDQGIGFQVRPWEDPAKMTPRAKLAKRITAKKPEPIDYNYEIVNLGDVHLRVVDKFYADSKQEADKTFDKWLEMKGLPNDTHNYGYRPRKQETAVNDIKPDVAQNFGDDPMAAYERNSDRIDAIRQDATNRVGSWAIYDVTLGREISRMDNVAWQQASDRADELEQSTGHNMSVRGLSENITESAGQYVTRIDDHPIENFGSNMQTYYHTKDWRESGQFPKGAKIPKRFTGQSQGVYAGDPTFTALYATGSSKETRYVAKYGPGQPIVWFDEKDLPRIRGKKTYLTTFDASNFKKVPSGEYFSDNPGTPIKQEPITDPFQYITNQGWVIRTTDDLPAVLKQLQTKKKQTKQNIQFGSEGMGVQENFANNLSETLPAKNLNQLYTIKRQLANPAFSTAEPAPAEKPVPAKPAQPRVHTALADLQRQRDKVQQIMNLKQEIETLTARAGRTRYGLTPGLSADIEDIYPNPATEADMDAAIQGYEVQKKKLTDYIARQRKVFPKESVEENFTTSQTLINELALKTTLPVVQQPSPPGKYIYDMKTENGKYGIVFSIEDLDENWDDEEDYDGPTGYALRVYFLGMGKDGRLTQLDTNIGEREVLKIYATIANLAVEIIRAHPEVTEIIAQGVNDQRQRIYTRLIQQNIGRLLPGWAPGGEGLVKIKENFADGKGPGRPGDSQRHGIPKGATMAELEKASHSKGRKGQLARWQLNMRRGHKK